MERIFSVDDIVGTLWKLDSNSNYSSSSNPVGEHIHGLESFLTQDSGGHAEEVFKKISRVDSDWAFQEFFKFQVSADSAKTESTDAPEKTMRRNESIWAFQEFLKNYVSNDSGKAEGKSVDADENEEDADLNCDLDLNANPSNVHGCCLKSKLDHREHGVDDGDGHYPEHSHSQGTDDGDGSNLERSDSLGVDDGDGQQSHSRSDHCSLQHGHGILPNPNDTDVDAHSYQQSSLQKPISDPLSKANLTRTRATGVALTLKGAHSIERHDSNLLEIPSRDSPYLSEIPEQQVSSALNPLFTGLQNVVPNLGHCNPHEYEIMLKRQLDMACAAVASTRACYRLNKGALQLVPMV